MFMPQKTQFVRWQFSQNCSLILCHVDQILLALSTSKKTVQLKMDRIIGQTFHRRYTDGSQVYIDAQQY